MKLRIPKFENTPYAVTHTDVSSAAKALSRFLGSRNTKTAILTGAGISTASGLPDYRGPSGTYTTNPNHKPTLYHEFVHDEHKRKRYWSRAWIGYEQALKWARPNVAHEVLTGWLQGGKIAGLITQNVDGLHKLSDMGFDVTQMAEIRSGSASPELVELHGSAYRVHCLSCGERTSREAFQDRMAEANEWSKENVGSMTGRGFDRPKSSDQPSDKAQFVDPGMEEKANQTKVGQDDSTESKNHSTPTITPGGTATSSNPYLASLDDSSQSRLDISGYNLSTGQQLNADGDAELDVEIDYDSVVIPPCLNCGGVLKPSIVFFGESVPEEDRIRARQLLQSSDQLLVIGTSLSTFSAFDLVRQFYKQGKKVAVLNKGGVRGEGKDWHADVRLDGDIGSVLDKVKF
ncbi:NAD-dependent protein deacylase SIR2rp2 [Yarrowia sp. B02]|nr:NAD-dependent protein deacylase SIR2rp2 [Yarrowia sp. B02]